jgi:uncharacterized membrane protein YoaK (UPF0700 family)
MMTKLPPWIWIGASALAFIAGILNAVGFLSFQHQGVSHLTGTTSLIGIALAEQNSGAVAHLLGVVLWFMFGAALSGFIIQDGALRLGRRYGAALLIESILLAAAVPLLNKQRDAGDYLISMACGLQNAMVSTYSGATLRTTHLTGVFTDLGIFVGHFFRRALRKQRSAALPPTEWRRFRLWITLIVSFGAGSAVGAALFPSWRYETLYLPSVLTGVVGGLYALYAFRQKRLHPAGQAAADAASA